MKFLSVLLRTELLTSPSMRREWIEMVEGNGGTTVSLESPSMRREWIEMCSLRSECRGEHVSLHAEGVD